MLYVLKDIVYKYLYFQLAVFYYLNTLKGLNVIATRVFIIPLYGFAFVLLWLFLVDCLPRQPSRFQKTFVLKYRVT